MSVSRKQEFHGITGSTNGYHGPVPGRPYSYHPNHGDAIAAIANSFNGISLANGSYPAGAHPKGPRNATEYSYNHSALPVPAGTQVAYPSPYAGLAAATAHAGAALAHTGVYHPHLAHYMQGGYHGYVTTVDGNHLGHGHGWNSRGASGEMPAMVTPRRDSVSSNEQDVPGTPYTTFGNAGVTVFDRSPSGVFTQSGTPSPSVLPPFHSHGALTKPTPSATTVPLAIQLMVQKEPAIPRAIPAPSSPIKPLDRSLENKNGETNVYIRGLHPETTDEMLQQWGRRFGEIQSSKSIIDMKTNLCKGFGFIKYYNYTDAEQCIRGFHYLGYEVSFARESFYAKLKKFSDEGNTNLYVSNIPRSMNEHELSEVFKPHKVVSCRILRDQQGNGRGVGFARFETRDICEEVIRSYNNTTIKKTGIEEHVIQIRYSDTHEQKVLKQQTAAARQFRAAEFEFGVMQARSTGTLPVIQPTSTTDESPDSASDSGGDNAASSPKADPKTSKMSSATDNVSAKDAPSGPATTPRVKAASVSATNPCGGGAAAEDRSAAATKAKTESC